MALLQNLLALILVFIPVLLWGYVFSYFDGVEFRVRKFVIGVVAGALSVLPIVYSKELFQFIEIPSVFAVFG